MWRLRLTAKPLEANPILVREVRARWRKWPAFAVAFGYSALLALWMGWCYSEAVSHAPAEPSPSTVASKMGYELFVQLASMQTILWMLLAPALTATSICGERERGLLDGLQLSPLTPRQIVHGKLFSALSFISLMLLVPLPIVALCFILGGVSPAEFIAATVLQFAVATTCAAIGLASSAVTRGPLAARGRALGIILLLNCTCLCCTSPLFAAVRSQQSGFYGPAVLIVVLQLLVVLKLQLNKAANALRKTPPHLLPNPALPSHSSWEYAQPPAAPSVATTSPAATGSPSSWEWRLLPLASRLRFGNPILHYEVRRHVRLRHGSPDVVMAMTWVFCLYSYILLLPAFVQASGLDSVFWTFSYLWTGAVILMTALFSATSFAREREQHTWEAIRLTPLTPWQIIRGKLAAPLVLCLCYSLPWLPIAVLCVRGLSDRDTGPHNIALTTLLAMLLLVAVSAWCTVALGLLLSWLSKRVWIATAWTLATLLFALGFSPSLLDVTRSPFAQRLLHAIHPFFALQRLENGGASAPAALAGTLLPALLLFGLGCVLLAILHRLVQNQE